MKARCVIAITLLGLVAAGCASAPRNFHTLVAAPLDPSAETLAELIDIEVEPVRVPASADRSELVVRRDDGTVAIAEGELWIAPLADEMRTAVVLELERRLRPLSHQLKAAATLRIAVRVHIDEFDAALGRSALLDAGWRLHVISDGQDSLVTCHSRVMQQVGPGYAELVNGYQRAVLSMVATMATAAQGMVLHHSAACLG
jgi:uncharacterized lipoprotein YmbA